MFWDTNIILTDNSALLSNPMSVRDSSTLIMSGERSLFPGSPKVLEEQEPGMGEAWPYVYIGFRVLKAAELYQDSAPNGKASRLVECSPALCCCAGDDRTLWPLSLCSKCLMSHLAGGIS